MDDKTAHVHVCACGTSWGCSKPDCHVTDECTTCELNAFEQWAEANALTVYQPELIELALAPKKD